MELEPYQNKNEGNFLLRIFITVFLSSPLIALVSVNQEVRENINKLNLLNSDRGIENTISLFISNAEYEVIKETMGTKSIVKPLVLLINGDTLKPEEINTRGQSTLLYPRKSFSFNLKSKALFRHGDRSESLKRFIVLSLSMDRNYCNNRLAFEMMEVSQIFGLFYSFCELRINDHSEGIHMVVERPEDWAMKEKNSPFLIRRGYNHSIDKIITDKTIQKSEIKKHKENYSQIYKCLNNNKGDELYKNLLSVLDIQTYMKWLAFNYLVRNGDFSDEVFFYFSPEIKKFSIIPWDYDDLYFPAPHEGNTQNRKLLEHKMIFSAEDLLDKMIAQDPYLYKIYLIHLKELLTQLSHVVLKAVFENTYAELYPYYMNEEIIKMSGYDAYKNASLKRLEIYMKALHEKLIISRDSCLDQLNRIF